MQHGTIPGRATEATGLSRQWEKAMSAERPAEEQPGRLSKDAIAKRLNTLAITILVICSAALLGFLTNVDSEGYRRDYEALKFLGELPEVSVSAADPKYDFNAYLAQHDPDLLRRCNEARADLIDRLTKLGYDREAIVADVAYRARQYSAVALLFSDEERQLVRRRAAVYDVRKLDSVNSLVDRFELIYRPRRLAVLTGVSDPPAGDLPTTPAGPRPRDGNRPDRGIAGFSLDSQNRVMRVETWEPEPPGSRAVGRRGEIRFAAAAVEIDGPSLATAMKLDPSPVADRLDSDAGRRGRLRSVYGPLDAQSAKGVTSDLAVRSFKQIEVLGLSFARDRLPVAVALILTALTFGVYVTACQAARRGHKVITEYADESVGDMVVDWPVTRVVAFLVLPVLAIWASLPSFPLGSGSYVWLAVCTLAVLGFGLGSLIVSRRL
jgi:hypothetical protein